MCARENSQNVKCQQRQLGPGDDLEMMSHPDYWPNWPVLPVKKYNKEKPFEFPECALMFAVEGHLFTVFEANLFMLSNIKKLIEDQSIVRHVYSSYEGVLKDGRIVD